MGSETDTSVAEAANQPSEEPLFELHFADVGGGGSPVVQFTWCIKQALLERIRTERVRFPYMLVSVVHRDAKGAYGGQDAHYKEADRLLIPLFQGGDQIEFNQPGDYEIRAAVLWTWEDTTGRPYEDAVRDLWKLLPRGDYESAFKVRIYEGLKFNPWITGLNNVVVDPVVHKIAVAQEFFAKQPPAWLWWWVNLWFERPPLNQCHFRRRAIIAFSIQPLLVALYLVLRTLRGIGIALRYALLGLRGLDLKPIYRPFTYTLDKIAGSKWERSYYPLTDKKGKDRPIWFPLVTTPVAVIFEVGLVWLFGWPLRQFTVDTANSVWNWVVQAVSWAGSKILIIVAIAALFFLLGRVLVSGFALISGLVTFKPFAYTWRHAVQILLHGLITVTVPELPAPPQVEVRNAPAAKPRRSRKEIEAERKRREREREQADALAALQPLACSATAPQTGRLRDLPKQQRTLHLRFLDFKAEVCKPFRVAR